MSSREPGKHPYARAYEKAAGERADRAFVPPFRAPSEHGAPADIDESEPAVAPGDDPDTPRRVGNGQGYGVTRAALVLVALALGVGLLVGRVSVNTDPAAVAEPSPSATSTQQTVPLGSTSLQETGALCSLQRGKSLVLGVEVRNVSTVPAQLQKLEVTLPKKGLTLTSTGVGACGEIDVPRLFDFGLPTQGTVWLSATVRVRVACPAALPVSMTIYAADLTGKVQAIKVPGFKNLKNATWSGCAAKSGTSTKASSAKKSTSSTKSTPARKSPSAKRSKTR